MTQAIKKRGPEEPTKTGTQETGNPGTQETGNPGTQRTWSSVVRFISSRGTRPVLPEHVPPTVCVRRALLTVHLRWNP